LTDGEEFYTLDRVGNNVSHRASILPHAELQLLAIVLNFKEEVCFKTK